MGERKWFQVERNKISSYICTAVLPAAPVGARPGLGRETLRETAMSPGCPWCGYEATAEGSRAVRGAWACARRDRIKPWALALPVAELFRVAAVLLAVTPLPSPPGRPSPAVWLFAAGVAAGCPGGPDPPNAHCKLCLRAFVLAPAFFGTKSQMPWALCPSSSLAIVALISVQQMRAVMELLRYGRRGGCWQAHKVQTSAILSSPLLRNSWSPPGHGVHCGRREEREQQ